MASPLIETNCGTLRGIFEKNINGGIFVAFKGIPYAVPPVGDLRFCDPLPIEPWTGIRDATKFGDVCSQYDCNTDTYIGSEDCLYLNVYMPNLDSSNLKAVMVWIHGGGFKCGSGNDDVYGVDYLIKKDVVIITLNYRLGCLGFLYLGDKVASGNQGLKDQILALKWVKQNISSFGGDPNNITIFGHSVGATCIHYLALSPMAQGLFQKAILQSGLISTVARPKSLVQVSRRLGTVLGLSISDPKTLVQSLRALEVEKLIEAQEKMMTPDEYSRLVILPFGPGPDEVSDNPCLLETDQEAIKLGIHIPCIIGYVSEESVLMQDRLKIICRNPTSLFPVPIQDCYDNWGISVNKIIKYYLGENEDDAQILSKFHDLATDVFFLSSTHMMLETQIKTSNAPVYYYKFSFDSNKTWMKMMIPHPGTCHGDDLSFLFHHKVMDILGKKPLCTDAIHYRIIQRFVEMWTNFAKTGNPTQETSELIPVIWEPIDNTKFHEYKYLQISDTVTMKCEKNHFQNFADTMSRSQ